MGTRKKHNQIAEVCRDALLRRIRELPVVPWDQIIYTFAQGMAGTELDDERIENTFLACVRKDERFQALLTPQQRRRIAQQA
jgi:hypothetical protein